MLLGSLHQFLSCNLLLLLLLLRVLKHENFSRLAYVAVSRRAAEGCKAIEGQVRDTLLVRSVLLPRGKQVDFIILTFIERLFNL